VYDFDLVVIGSGPGGQKAAIAAAKLGKRVCLVERRNMVGWRALRGRDVPLPRARPRRDRGRLIRDAEAARVWWGRCKRRAGQNRWEISWKTSSGRYSIFSRPCCRPADSTLSVP
jgi:choline dehydrogenase-like flavoprotein